jgi:hypothetical protein
MGNVLGRNMSGAGIILHCSRRLGDERRRPVCGIAAAYNAPNPDATFGVFRMEITRALTSIQSV